ETMLSDIRRFEYAADWNDELARGIKGSLVAVGIFKAGTFLGSFASEWSEKEYRKTPSEIVQAARQVIRRQLENKGLHVGINNVLETEFVVTVLGRSPQLDFPAGYWFMSRLEITVFARSEPRAPGGKVEQLNTHVNGFR